MLRWNRHQKKFLGVFCLACTALIAALDWRGFAPLLLLNSATKNYIAQHGTKSPQRPELVYLAIDQPSIKLDKLFDDEIAASPALSLMKQGWPWSREVYPQIIQRLVDAGASVVAFDLLFPTSREGDEAFRAALERFRDNVVLGSNFVDLEQEKKRTYSALDSPAVTLIPELDDRVGFVNFWPDLDGCIRRAKYRVSADEVFGLPPSADAPVYFSLAARMLQKSGHAASIPTQNRPFRYSSKFPPRSIYEIFVPEIWKANYQNGEFFRGKIVLIGPEGDWSKDKQLTPFGNLPGPEIHLHALNAALNGDFITEPSRAMEIELIFLAGIIAWALSAFVAQPVLRLLLFLFVAVFWYVVAQAAFGYFSYNPVRVLTSLGSPMAALIVTGPIWLAWEQMMERREKNRMRRTLDRYVSKNVVREILDNPSSYLNDLGGVRKCVAILITDLRDFTTMSEETDSSQLVAQLNEYFAEMVRPIFVNKGTVDKFIGDAILAVWGNVHTDGPECDAELAIRTALQMRTGLARLNADWRARGMREFVMGIGINYGEAIFGNIGSSEKMDPTVIGDAVNLAARIEGLTKEYGIDLLLGQRAAELMTDVFHLQFVDFVRVKGKTKPVQIFTVHGERTKPLDPALEQYLAQYAAGVEKYRARDFGAAAELFAQCLTTRVGDSLASLYAERCRELQSRAVDPAWDGVYVMTDK